MDYARPLVLGVALMLGCGGRVALDSTNLTGTGGVLVTSGSSHGGTTGPSMSTGSPTDAAGGVASDSAGSSGSAGETSFVEFRPVDAAELQQIYSGACDGWMTECEPGPLNQLWVIDLSDDLTRVGQAGERNWDRTKQELAGVTPLLQSIQVSSSWYLSFFPNLLITNSTKANQASCIDPKNDTWIRIDPADQSAAAKAWQTAIDQVSPIGKTGAPILDAYRRAASMVDEFTDGAPVIVLVTAARATVAEGCRLAEKPSSSAFDPIIAEIEKLRVERGIRTLVVGANGSRNSGSWGPDMGPALSRAAIAGGLATRFDCSADGPIYCHVDLDRGDSLVDAISHLGGCSEIVCRGELSTQTWSRVDGAVALVRDASGQTYQVGVTSDLDCQRGVRLSSNGVFEMCPETCAKLSFATPYNAPSWVIPCAGSESP